MKTITLAMCLLIATFSNAQPSINVGMNSRMQAAFKAAIEKQTQWNNTELSASFSLDNKHPIIGLQTGISTQLEHECTNYRFMIGAFYHTGLLPVDKEIGVQQIRPGASIRSETRKILFALEYNGETLAFHIGYRF